jgi:hypothetical protein
MSANACTCAAKPFTHTFANFFVRASGGNMHDGPCQRRRVSCSAKTSRWHRRANCLSGAASTRTSTKLHARFMSASACGR